MQKIIISFLLTALLFISNVSHSQWYQQNSGTSERLNDVFFVNSLTGWAVGDTGIIIKTTNGGINWFQQFNSNDNELQVVRFINENTGWAVGGEHLEFSHYPYCFDYGVILKTTDGGGYWHAQLLIYKKFYDITIIDSNIAFASFFGSDPMCIITQGGIYKTTNGGMNWNAMPNLEYSFGFKTLYFINENTGWTIGYSASCTYSMRRIMKTTNSGINWLTIQQDSSLFEVNFYFSNLRFLDTLNGFLLDGCLTKTSDGGYNWINIDSIATAPAKGYHYINIDTGWIVGNNSVIKRTNNGGNTWSTQYNPNTGVFNSVFFVDKNTGWAVGSNGTIVKTITGGVTSVKQISTLIPEKSSLLQNYPNPFNPVTTIRYDIKSTGKVNLKVFNINGREILVLANERQSAGTYEVVFDAASLPSGVYFYQLKAGDFVETRKMLVVK